MNGIDMKLSLWSGLGLQSDKSATSGGMLFLGSLGLRRGKIEMIRGILEAARRGATKTEIVYKSNLNFRIVDQCLVGLLKAGYMAVRKSRDGKAMFYTTEKGFSFLGELTRLGKTITELLTASGEPENAEALTLVPEIGKNA